MDLNHPVSVGVDPVAGHILIDKLTGESFLSPNHGELPPVPPLQPDDKDSVWSASASPQWSTYGLFYLAFGLVTVVYDGLLTCLHFTERDVLHTPQGFSLSPVKSQLWFELQRNLYQCVQVLKKLAEIQDDQADEPLVIVPLPSSLFGAHYASLELVMNSLMRARNSFHALLARVAFCVARNDYGPVPYRKTRLRSYRHWSSRDLLAQSGKFSTDFIGALFSSPILNFSTPNARVGMLMHLAYDFPEQFTKVMATMVPLWFLRWTLPKIVVPKSLEWFITARHEKCKAEENLRRASTDKYLRSWKPTENPDVR